MNHDEQHLQVLSMFHYVVGGITALMALLPIFHLVLGIVFILAPPGKPGTPDQAVPAILGWLFVTFAGMFILLGWVLATLIAVTGRRLTRRRNYWFCMIMAGIECVLMPFGTVLGIFTIIVLSRDSVKALFGAVPPVPGNP